MKAFALALLILALSGFALSVVMGRQGVWGWVGAFCEAATVGALADWFAVTALFRRLPFRRPPLPWLTIPHTGIIPANKSRIADSLAAFVRDHFMDPPMLLGKLKAFDPARRLGLWLGETSRTRRVVGVVRAAVLRGLDLLDEQSVQRAMQTFIVARLRQWDSARTASEVMGLLTRDGRHQRLLDEVLRRLGDYLQQDDVRARVSGLLVGFAGKQWPKTLKLLDKVTSVEDMADSLAERLALSFLDEMQTVLSQPQHPLRKQYEQWLADYIQRLGRDEKLVEQVNRIKDRVIDHPQLQEYIRELWAEIHASLRRDLADEHSVLGQYLEQTLTALAERLAEDEELRDTLNMHVLDSAESMVASLRGGVTEHIAQTLKGWDDRQLVRELELSVGRDLQWVRYNGTLVGGMIGLALYAVVLLMR